jgi:predicted phosphodiesterase
MIKILLISDTHGHLDVINDLAEKEKVDLAIHAGDFGFYDESSYKHISSRELRLLVSHSTYWRNYSVDKQTDRETLIGVVKRHQLLGNFSDYQDSNKKFHVPVYAVYGNHEDSYVLKKLKLNSNIYHSFDICFSCQSRQRTVTNAFNHSFYAGHLD